MNKQLREKIRESLSAVLPVSLLVLVMCFIISGIGENDISNSTVMMFVFGAVMLVLGMGLFSLGADMAMLEIGQKMGKKMAVMSKKWLMLLILLGIGIAVTVAEPDLMVLAEQISGDNIWWIILPVGIGTGLLLVVAILRSFFNFSLSKLLVILYLAVFGVAAFVAYFKPEYLPVSFDSGGVTTGPITVPFIMALGLGLAGMAKFKGSARKKRAVGEHADSDSDGFGVIAICSVGPILAVLILGLMGLKKPVVEEFHFLESSNPGKLAGEFFGKIPTFALEVLIALAPIIVFFVIFQIFSIKLRRRQLVKVIVGLVYTYIGLVLFLVGVSVGFSPAGYQIGGALAGLQTGGGFSFGWVLIPIGMIIGALIVRAEPAVAILNKQVEESTGGAISRKVMMTGLSIGMAVSVGLSMVRSLYSVNLLWLIVPGYLIALALSFFVPKMFTAVAFDSGGVASGPMATTFLLPLAMGVSKAVDGSVILDAFGMIAMVAMTPLVTIQIIGVIYKVRLRKGEAGDAARIPALPVEDFIDLPLDERFLNYSTVAARSASIKTALIENYDDEGETLS